MEVITKENEEVQAFFASLKNCMAYVDNVTANFCPVMNGEVYLTGEDVCRICISQQERCRITGRNG